MVTTMAVYFCQFCVLQDQDFAGFWRRANVEIENLGANELAEDTVEIRFIISILF